MKRPELKVGDVVKVTFDDDTYNIERVVKVKSEDTYYTVVLHTTSDDFFKGEKESLHYATLNNTIKIEFADKPYNTPLWKLLNGID